MSLAKDINIAKLLDRKKKVENIKFKTRKERNYLKRTNLDTEAKLYKD